MKSLKYIAAVCVGAALLSGCQGDGFLSNNSPSAMGGSNIFNNPTFTEQTIFGVYDLMGSNNGYRNRMACGYVGMNTDIEWSSKSSGSGDEPDLMMYDVKPTNSRIFNANGSDLWAYLNTMIERCNNIIEGVEEYGDLKNDDKLNYLLGEAYFLRSFAYLEQVKYWGDVPARFVSLAKDGNGVNARKADRNEIFAQLRVDLKKAAELMPWSAEIPLASAKNNVGRPSKAAALALLARADLMYAGKAVRPNTLEDPSGYSVRYNVDDANLRKEIYAEAMDACAQIINKEDFKLAADFAQPFKQICSDVMNYAEMEHIWVMPFTDGGRGQVLNYNAPKLSSDAQSAVAGVLGGFGKGASSNGHMCISPALAFKYDPADKRRDVTFVLGQWEYNDASETFKDAENRTSIFNGLNPSEKRLYQKANQSNNFYLGKFRWEWMKKGANITSTDDGVDFPVIRYADVLLMFAEASIGGISGDAPVNNTNVNPVAQFNKVRTRAGVATVENLDMETIMQERAFELCGEYIRKFDLMRWGNLKEKMVAAEKYIREIAADNTRHAAGMGDTLYFHYVYDEAIGGWMIHPDAIASNNRPTTHFGYMGVTKDLFNSDSKGYVLGANQYPIFSNEENLEKRQYWPISEQKIAASNGTLWNNYGY